MSTAISAAVPSHKLSTTLRYAGAFSTLLLLAGCGEKDPISIHATDNPDISYSVLFHRAGCEFGRFVDADHYVYTVICPPGSGTGRASYDYTVTCGKGCVRTMNQTSITGAGNGRTDETGPDRSIPAKQTLHTDLRF